GGHHTPLMILPPNLNQADLTNAKVDATCDQVQCVIKLNKGMGVRLVSEDFQTSGDPVPIKQPSGNDFDREVPHVKHVAPGFKLESEASDNVPSQTDVLAY